MKKLNRDAIDLGPRKTGTISSLLDKYMEKFTVHQSPHLFDMNDETKLIKQGICPVCLCNLKVSKKGDVFCNSKKHLTITKKRFFITKLGMEKFK